MSSSIRHLFDYKNRRRCTVLAAMIGSIMLIAAGGFARASWAARPEAGIGKQVKQMSAGIPSDLSNPAGLYIQEWNAYDDQWESSWNSWAAGPMMRTVWTKVDSSTGSVFAFDFALNYRYIQYGALNPIPSDKKLLIGFYPKNNISDCYFGIPEKYYTHATYDPLQLKYNGQNVTRTCNGQSISTAVNFLDDDVKRDLATQIRAFIGKYANNPKIAGFSFAGGANDESTPWVHPTDGTIGNVNERPYEKYTYSMNYSGEDWANYNLWFVEQIKEALEEINSNKIAYYNYTQTWPDPGAWREAIRCIGGETTNLCDDSAEPAPITSKQIGLKHSGLAADTLTGGSYNGVCSWYDPDLSWFWGDWWKMMRWAYDEGLSTNWEFNNSFMWVKRSIHRSTSLCGSC